MSKKELFVFDGATAVITRGASGIGRALAEELANRGCEVVLADLQVDLAEEVAAAIRAVGAKPVHTNSMSLTMRLSSVFCKKLLRGQVVLLPWASISEGLSEQTRDLKG